MASAEIPLEHKTQRCWPTAAAQKNAKLALYKDTSNHSQPSVFGLLQPLDESAATPQHSWTLTGQAASAAVACRAARAALSLLS